MNQGRIWTVVHPTIGLPLFLGGVAVVSLTVHFAILNNTTWVKDFFQGVPMKKAQLEKAADPVAAKATSAKPAMAIDLAQSTAAPADGTTAVVVKIKPELRTPKVNQPVPG